MTIKAGIGAVKERLQIEFDTFNNLAAPSTRNEHAGIALVY